MKIMLMHEILGVKSLTNLIAIFTDINNPSMVSLFFTDMPKYDIPISDIIAITEQ